MTSTGKRNTKKIISIDIDTIQYDKAVTEIIAFGKARAHSFVCFANVHMTIEAYQNSLLASKIDQASLVLADGVPLLKALKLFYGIRQERIAGMDIFPTLLKHAEIHDLKVLFFGTTNEILEKIRIRAEKDFPSINIVGLISPPFEKSLDDEIYSETINASGANLVFVALGCPKQEIWMANHSPKIKGVLLGVGGAFPVYAGVVERAPVFIQNAGLEWLFRFLQEPRRLFKRYLKTNSLFIYLVLKKKLFERTKK